MAEINDRPPPTTCKECGEQNCDDWMYNCKLVPAEQAWCGKCKRKFENKLYDSILKEFPKWLKSKKD